MNAELDLKRLHHLVLLADQRNFTRAAAQAHLSQTAFSRSIQALEDRVGVRLFDRGTRLVRPTAAGQQIIDKARRLLAQARELSSELQGIAGATGGELRFGASAMAVDSVLKGLVPPLLRDRPGLSLHVEVGHWRALLDHLLAERIEFFVAHPGLLIQDPDYLVTPLAAQPSSVFCRPGHPLLCSTTPPRPQDLPRFGWATVQLKDAAVEPMHKIYGVAAGTPLPVALCCDNLPVLREAVLGSDLLLFTWSAWLQADVEQGLLVDIGARLQPQRPLHSRSISCAIVQPRARSMSPAAQALVRRIVQAQQAGAGASGPPVTSG